MFYITCLTVSSSGCVGRMDFISRSELVDRSITTGSIAAPSSKTQHSDETAVGNAVSAVDLLSLGGSHLPWANTETGSAGVVQAIKESSEFGRTCREFRTTRHSYDGIAVFHGQTCMTGRGNWTLTAFDRQG